MRNCLLVVCSLVLCVSVSAAQGKISSQWKCDKPSEQHSIAVPDGEGHNYSLAQGKCTSEKGSMGDAKEQEGTYSEFGDMANSMNHNHGVFVVTLASGDKVFYRYHGTQTLKDGNPASGTNKWTIEGGTGKYKAVKGAGGCKGKGNADGSSTWDCDGSYSGAK
ncbi:MAG TPA: hypothetical protein VF133_14600 [Terriglobales bacterium]